MIDELLPITRELLDGKPVSIVVARSTPTPTCCSTDRRKLNRALACLLSNAAKFTDAGEIRVGARGGGDGAIEIAIADTGIGIAPHDLAIIFDDFRQVDGSFTRRFGGLGIGLTLARELIALLGGALELESDDRRRHDRARAPAAHGDRPRSDAAIARAARVVGGRRAGAGARRTAANGARRAALALRPSRRPATTNFPSHGPSDNTQ